jgi:acyl-CoA thioester hydrolase
MTKDKPVDIDAHALAGALSEGTHRLLQRVYYEDTDFSGFVYHARYLHFLERGRTDFLRCLGVSQSALVAGDDALIFVVRHMDLHFRSPARMDDVIEVETRLARIGGARMVLGQAIRRDDALLIQATVEVAIVDGTGRPRRLPADIAARLAEIG